MRQQGLEPYRKRVIAAARGVVLEIGIGSGLNFPLYGTAVARIYAIDSSAELLAMAAAATEHASCSVLLMRGSAENLPLADAAIDRVVTTWTLCSIPDAARALHEMRRVLKPGGQLLFVEHGLAPEPSVARWQHWLTPAWRRIGGGCHLDRKMDAMIGAAGFEIGQIETGYMPGPKPMTFMYEGRAAPGSADQ